MKKEIYTIMPGHYEWYACDENDNRVFTVPDGLQDVFADCHVNPEREAFYLYAEDYIENVCAYYDYNQEFDGDIQELAADFANVLWDYYFAA